MGIKKSRVSLSSNIEVKIEEIVDTPLPLPPSEIDFSAFGEIMCEDDVCKTVQNAQREQTQKLQNLCQLYYNHIQSLHSLIEQQKFVQKSLATPKTNSVKRFTTVSSGNSSARGADYISKIESSMTSNNTVIKKSQITTSRQSKVQPFEILR